MKVEKIKEPSKYSFWVILLAVVLASIGIVLVWRWISPPVNASEVVSNGDECVDVYAPEPVTQSINVAKRGTIMATFQWFEESEGVWTLKLDTDPRGGVESWVTEYPASWGLFANKPLELPQTITEYECPKPDENKSVTIVEACDKTATVTIYGGNTRRTWRVDGVEGWVEKYATVEFAGTIDSVVEWNHKGEWQLANEEEYVTRTPAVCEPEVTPTNPPQKSESKPEGCTHDCGIPACTDLTPNPVTNPHIYRNGSCALVKYWPSSDQVNIYWKEVSASDWQHALANQPATGNHEICGLSGDVTFGVQSVSGCAADGIVNASTISSIVDGDTSTWILFR